jgi:hypothetical protein
MPRLGDLGLAGVFFAAAGCAQLGYTDRVLHRAPSPDGQVVAVCQEVPMFDGPEFEVRLDRSDGSLIRQLHYMGDAGGCTEMVWSEDGRTLAVLTSHVAEITVIDVQWALSHPDIRQAHWYRRGFSFSNEGAIRRAARLTFISPLELEFQLCDYSIEETRQNRGVIRCSGAQRPQRLRIPSPLVADRPV